MLLLGHKHAAFTCIDSFTHIVFPPKNSYYVNLGLLATLCGYEVSDYLNILNDPVIPSVDGLR